MNNPLLGLMALAAWPMTSAILKRQIEALKRVAETCATVQAKAASKRAVPSTTAAIAQPRLAAGRKAAAPKVAARKTIRRKPA